MSIMRLSFLVVILSCSPTYALVTTNTWTTAGGGLNPATYGGNFRPPTLVSDTGSTGVASIAMSGLTSGGLGSANLGAYGGIYSFFSTGLVLNLQTTNSSSGLERVSLTFLAGGGSPALSYTNSSLALNYNPENSAVASSLFSTVPGIVVDSPLGPQDLTAYTWTWTNLALLGSSSGFSIAWSAPVQHAFITDIALTQAVPEPSVFALLVLGGLGLWLCRDRMRIG